MQNKLPYEPLVSVALTTSKSELFIREQIDSLLSQTYRNIEVVISHDECGDNTVAILNEYVKRDPRVRWSYNLNQKGFIKNTESAIVLSRGEIIFLCDHDDSWYPEKIEEHVKVYRDSCVGWVYNRLVITDADNKKEIGYIEDTLPDYYRDKSMLENAWGSCIGGAQTSYRASLLHNAMPIGKYAPAHDSWIQLAIWPAKSVFINKILQKYRQHANNAIGMSSGADETFEERETRAIFENLRYLRSLADEKVLPFWKRTFFMFVYWAKVVRVSLRNLFV